MDLSQLTPEQRQQVLMQAQQEANQRIMSDVSDSIRFDSIEILRFYLSPCCVVHNHLYL